MAWVKVEALRLQLRLKTKKTGKLRPITKQTMYNLMEKAASTKKFAVKYISGGKPYRSRAYVTAATAERIKDCFNQTHWRQAAA